jgi:hypothetical protein
LSTSVGKAAEDTDDELLLSLNEEELSTELIVAEEVVAELVVATEVLDEDIVSTEEASLDDDTLLELLVELMDELLDESLSSPPQATRLNDTAASAAQRGICWMSFILCVLK